jgi:hypothetical protein
VKLTFANDAALGDIGSINNCTIYYNFLSNTLFADDTRIRPNDAWADKLKKAAPQSYRYNYMELTNPVLLDYVCYLIEVGELEV